MLNPLSRRYRHRGGAAALAVAGIAATVFAPVLLATPTASAAPPPGVDAGTGVGGDAGAGGAGAGRGAAAGRPECAGYGAAAAGDLVTLRVLDLRALGVPLPALTDLRLATTRAGFTSSGATSAAQGRYVQGTAVLGFSPPLGPVDSQAHRLAPPATEPEVVNPSQVNLGPLRAGSGNLTARAAYDRPERCDHTTGVDSEASAALTDAAVLPARRTLVGVIDNQSTRARTGMVRYRGRTAAEAVTTSSLARLAIFEALRLRVSDTTSLRVVAGGSAKASTVEYHAPLIGLDLPDGRQVQLDQAGRSFDFAVPAPGTSPVAGLPVLPTNSLPDLVGALPGGVGALPALGGVLGGLGRGGRTGAPENVVSPSAGSIAPPAVPGLPALGGIPAVGGLLGGTGRLATPDGQPALVLRLTGGELSKEIADSGAHAKAITLRLKLLLVRGDDVTTLIDLCIGVLEAAATAPATTTRDEGRGRGRDGYGDDDGGEEPDDTGSPAPVDTPSPGGGVAGGPVPTGSKLPLTGNNVTAVIVAAIVLLLGGRLLMVLAKRRTG